jgi:8-oxo-dGTP pyrophosphatase MutT (NUDIX family)
MKKVASGALIVSRGSRRTLVGQRTKNMRFFPSLWAQWGGLMNPGESPEEVAIREFREETGFKSNIDAIHQLTANDNGDVFYHNHLFVIRNEFSPNLSNEHDAFEWIKFEDIRLNDKRWLEGFAWTIKTDWDLIQKILDEM